MKQETLSMSQAKVNTYYMAIAYRLGRTNDHWYVVYVGDNQEKAMALAADEASSRNGNYGVATFKVNDTHDPEMSYRTMLCYYPSSMEEVLPHHNYQYDMLMDMGLILNDYVQGHVYRISEDNPQTPAFVEKVAVTADELVVKEAARRKAKYDVLEYQQKERLEVYREG